ncbi:UDP-glucose 6-dehydrogenase 1 [Pseudocyphellaria aurata]|nr:UDP-glucose 6-dehydrogenase 1 [Pseudocyphellaria aurata]
MSTFPSSASSSPGHKTVSKITCLGSGFVGGPTSAVTAFMSNVVVTVVDIDSARIAAWQSDSLPIYEPGLHNIVSTARDGIKLDQDSPDSVSIQWKNGRISDIKDHEKFTRRPNLFFSTDVDKAIEDADLIFVCVNTPTKRNGVGKGAAPDLGFVEAATRNIAKIATENKIVVEKSTVPCRTAQYIREILSANAHPGVRFDVLSNPEFLAEGTAIRDLLYPDRIIIGSMPTPAGRRAAASLAAVYAQWVPQERIITMNLWSSELSKLAANAMLAQRISSVNALSAICEATGADVAEVSHACGLDSRIGPKMLKAGPGFGGSCFQKDIFNIVYLSESLHLYEVADYWRTILNMNEYQKQRFTKRIISCLFHNLTDKKIAVLGFAFKKDTSDTRESPAITLVRNFVAERAQVAIYDPQVKEPQIWTELVNDGGDLTNLKQSIGICDTAYAACAGADAVVIVTEWDEFSNKTDLPIPETIASSCALRDVSPNRSFQPRVLSSPDELEEKLARSSFSRSSSGRSQIENRERAPMASIGERFESLDLAAESKVLLERQQLDWARVAKDMRKPKFVFDGRGVVDAAKLEALGFRVEAIGRASAVSRELHD